MSAPPSQPLETKPKLPLPVLAGRDTAEVAHAQRQRRAEIAGCISAGGFLIPFLVAVALVFTPLSIESSFSALKFIPLAQAVAFALSLTALKDPRGRAATILSFCILSVCAFIIWQLFARP